MKEAGFVRGNIGDAAEPDWDRFGTQIANLINLAADRELTTAAQYLLQHPPMKQVINAQGGLAWEQRPFPNLSEIERLLLSVRRVRNNLFHGGKFMAQESPNRDLFLVTYSLVILEAVLPLEPAVEQAFMLG